MSLSDFMPYGAPELLEGAAPRMARSTMVATGLVATLVWLAGMLASGQRTVAIPEIPPLPPIKFKLLPDPHIIPARPPELVPASPRSIDGELRPVPVPPILEPPAIDPARVDESSTPPPGEWNEAGRERGREDHGNIEPRIDEFVYTDEQPQPVRCADAVYPDLAREAGVEGTVHVRMLLGLNGHVIRAVLEPGSRTTMLDEAALTAARTCVFTPALANGHPVMVWVSQAYRFRLH